MPRTAVPQAYVEYQCKPPTHRYVWLVHARSKPNSARMVFLVPFPEVRTTRAPVDAACIQSLPDAQVWHRGRAPAVLLVQLALQGDHPRRSWTCASMIEGRSKTLPLPTAQRTNARGVPAVNAGGGSSGVRVAKPSGKGGAALTRTQFDRVFDRTFFYHGSGRCVSVF